MDKKSGDWFPILVIAFLIFLILYSQEGFVYNILSFVVTAFSVLVVPIVGVALVFVVYRIIFDLTFSIKQVAEIYVTKKSVIESDDYDDYEIETDYYNSSEKDEDLKKQMLEEINLDRPARDYYYYEDDYYYDDYYRTGLKEVSVSDPSLKYGAVLVVLLLIYYGLYLYDADSYIGESVWDGDNIILSDGTSIRLLGINAPEMSRPNGPEAKEKLEALVEGHTLILDCEGEGEYGRTNCHVFNEDGKLVNEEMLREGYAIWYPYQWEYSKYAERYEAAQEEARENERGIWKLSQFESVVEIDWILYDPPGDEVVNERVKIVNNAPYSVDLSNWWLYDMASRTAYNFPNYILDGDDYVMVFTGSVEVSEQALYWGSGNPIWNNDGDIGYLIEGNGLLVDYYPYEKGV